jgi:hypothetical protein
MNHGHTEATEKINTYQDESDITCVDQIRFALKLFSVFSVSPWFKNFSSEVYR